MKSYYPGNYSGNDRRYNRNQNTYDSGLTNKGSGSYWRNGTHRKKQGHDSDAVLTEGISAIKDYLKEITGLQKRLVDSQEQIARAQETHAEAMQQIADCVKIFLGQSTEQPPASVMDDSPDPGTEPVALRETPVNEIPDESGPEASLSEEIPEKTVSSTPASTGALAEAALKVIAEMRENRMSFEKIADHLVTQGIPPVPGNGKWNRRTVSKFYKAAAI